MKRIDKVSASELARMNKASLTWLIGRINYFRKAHSIPGAINAANYTNPRLFLTGEVFMFTYDAKTKDKLPYWDKFPLVIPIEIYGDGFLGLNLHYLPPDMRIAFLNKLIDLVNTPPGDIRTRMKISYDIIKGSQKFASASPCLKRYLVDHIQGKIVKIFPHEWIMCAYLPLQSFQKAQARTVWSESKAIIRAKGLWKKTNDAKATKKKQDDEDMLKKKGK